MEAGGGGGRGDVGRADSVRMDTVSVIECKFGQAEARARRGSRNGNYPERGARASAASALLRFFLIFLRCFSSQVLNLK